jgi:uncharacterized protein YcfJ
MNIRKRFFRKNTVTSLCVAIVTTALMTGCITNPRTGQSMLDPKAATAIGALLGGVGGAFAGKAFGGKSGMAIGGLTGTLLGGLAGYYINNYLNAQEEQEYLASLNQQMKATPANMTGENSWVNANHTKAVNTGYTEEVSLQRLRSKVDVNQNAIASLPSNTTCRSAKIQVSGQQASDIMAAYCRDANGDYVKVNGTNA